MTLKLWSLFCLTFSIHYRFILENLRVILILFLLLFNLIYSAFCYLRLFLREYECPFIFRVYSTFSSDIIMLWMKKNYMYIQIWKNEINRTVTDVAMSCCDDLAVRHSSQYFNPSNCICALCSSCFTVPFVQHSQNSNKSRQITRLIISSFKVNWQLRCILLINQWSLL